MKSKSQKRRGLILPPPFSLKPLESEYRNSLWAILAHVKANVDRHLPFLLAQNPKSRKDSGGIVIEVDPRSLVGHQIVDTDKMAAIARDKTYEKKFPIVSLFHKGLAIIDGHHRVAAAISNGETKIKVIQANGLVGKMHDELQKQIAGIPFYRADSKFNDTRLDDWSDDTNHVFHQLRSVADQAAAHARELARHTSNRVKEQNKRSFQRTMKAALGVDILHDAPEITSTVNIFALNNVHLIKSLPDQYLDQVHGVIMRGFQAGDRAEDIGDELEERFEVAESRAVLIARDQVSKLNGALTQDRQENLGIKGYFWRTSRDERVRETHASNEGEYFDWDDPDPETGHPGEDIQCRCHADPDVSDLLGSGDEETDQEEADQ